MCDHVCNQLWNGPQSPPFLHTAGAKGSKASSDMNKASWNSPSICIVDIKILMFSGNQHWFLMFLMDFNYLQICELQIVLNEGTNWLSVYLITHLGQFLFFCMGCFVVELGWFLFSFFLLSLIFALFLQSVFILHTQWDMFIHKEHIWIYLTFYFVICC